MHSLGMLAFYTCIIYSGLLEFLHMGLIWTLLGIICQLVKIHSKQPICFPPLPFFLFFLRGKTVLYRQPSVSLSFRPSNPTIHYGAFLTSAAWQHNKDDILIQWLVISAKQRQVLQLLLLCEQCHIGKASYANIALGGFYDSSWMGRLAWCCFLWFLAP